MVEKVTPLRKLAIAPETARERAFRLETEARQAAESVISEAIEAFEAAVLAGTAALDLANGNRGVQDELRRLCGEAETRLQTIRAIKARI